MATFLTANISMPEHVVAARVAAAAAKKPQAARCSLCVLYSQVLALRLLGGSITRVCLAGAKEPAATLMLVRQLLCHNIFNDIT
jgi:hypothetical protein